MQPLGKTVGGFSKIKNDAAISLLGIYSKKLPLIQKDTCTPIFIATLFTVTKTWQQAKCPSADEWIKKMWCVYTYIYAMEHHLARWEWRGEHWRCSDAPQRYVSGAAGVQERSRGKNKDVFSTITESWKDRRAAVLKL